MVLSTHADIYFQLITYICRAILNALEGDANFYCKNFAPMLNDLKVRTDVDKVAGCAYRIPGRGSRACRRCGNHRGFNRKYDINLCRRCLHAKAEEIGFNTYN